MLQHGHIVLVDKEKACYYYKLAADHGNANAMNSYTYMIQHGDGTTINKTIAIQYYKKSIERKNSDAMNNYALI